MSYKRSSHGSGSRSGSSPIIKDILLGALDMLTEPSSSSHSRSSSSRRERDRDYDSHHSHHRDHPRDRDHPRRTATQPEPRRHRDTDEYAGIPSHSYSTHDDPRAQYHSSRSKSNSDDLKDMLGKAAIELGRLVSGLESKLRVRNDRVDAGAGQFRSDDERFEVLSDSEPETYQTNHRSHGEDRQRDAPRGNTSNQQQHHQQQTPGGLADDYYFPEYLPGNPHAPQAASAPPHGISAAYASGPIHPPAQNDAPPYMNYQHPQPVDPTFPDYHNPADAARPKPKRSSTSASQTMRKVGSEILQNLPQLLERAGWLLKVLERQQKGSGGKRSVAGYSGLLMALNLVMELYRQFGGERRLREEGRSRDRRY